MTAALAGALLSGLGLTGTASAAPAAPAVSKIYLHTVTDQWTHWTPDAATSSHAGELYAGDNYFYCYDNGELYMNPANGRWGDIWLRTDDDSGNRNVWVSSSNLTQAEYAQAVSILPNCSFT